MKIVMQGVVVSSTADECIVYVSDYNGSPHDTHYIVPLEAKKGDNVSITCEVIDGKGDKQ